MNDLISKSALIESLIACEELKGRRTVEAVAKVIKEEPAVDAKPVVHGKWEECGWVELDGHGGLITYPKEGMRCSNCNRAFKKVLLWTDNFCPNCGAYMKKGE